MRHRVHALCLLACTLLWTSAASSTPPDSTAELYPVNEELTQQPPHSKTAPRADSTVAMKTCFQFEATAPVILLGPGVGVEYISPWASADSIRQVVVPRPPYGTTYTIIPPLGSATYTVVRSPVLNLRAQSGIYLITPPENPLRLNLHLWLPGQYGFGTDQARAGLREPQPRFAPRIRRLDR